MRISDLSSDVCSSDLARVTGLRIANFEMADDSFDKVAAEIAALPGRTGFLVAKLDGGTVKPIASAHSDEQFAVGSIVKLYILDELAAQVAAGKRRWSDVVPLSHLKIGRASCMEGVGHDGLFTVAAEPLKK